jgi:DNA-binding NtrC family response regulator
MGCRMESARITVIAPSESFSEIWAQLARFAGAQIEVSPTVGESTSIQSTSGVVIAAGGVEDCSIPLLHELKAAGAPDPVVAGVETNYRTVAGLLQAGATNYFALPGDYMLFRSWIVEQVERESYRKKAEVFTAGERKRFDFSRMIGRSPHLLDSLDRASRVIPRGSATVLVMGETGTGKELLARAIHYNGPRAGSPFVEINCSALPENLLEAELFGYEPGAFTDARVPKPGLFEIASGGTLFLDEIGDLSPQLQAKLLRVLEQRRVRRLGSVRDVDVDVRIVAATHVDLPAAVEDGRFRSDLYYRINVVPLRLPPLRERGDDVLLLAEYFLQRFATEYDMPKPRLDPEIRRALRSYPWPGNVRELRNAVERALLLGGGHLFPGDLFPDGAPRGAAAGVLPFPAPMSEIERAAAHAMVEHCGGNKSQAAKALGISRKHLYSLLSEVGR